MATYLELLTIGADIDLGRKIRIACVIAAEAIRTELSSVPSHDARLAWAKGVFRDPQTEGDRMIWPVLAQNKDATVSQITGATDAAIQTAVNAAVNVFAV